MRWFMIVSNAAGRRCEFAAFHLRQEARAYGARRRAAGYSVKLVDRNG